MRPAVLAAGETGTHDELVELLAGQTLIRDETRLESMCFISVFMQ